MMSNKYCRGLSLRTKINESSSNGGHKKDIVQINSSHTFWRLVRRSSTHRRKSKQLTQMILYFLLNLLPQRLHSFASAPKVLRHALQYVIHFLVWVIPLLAMDFTGIFIVVATLATA